MYFTAITIGTSSKAGFPTECIPRYQAQYTKVSDRGNGWSVCSVYQDYMKERSLLTTRKRTKDYKITQAFSYFIARKIHQPPPFSFPSPALSQ